MSSISGNMWKINVSVGDQVNIEDEVTIIESMKMEIPVESEGSEVVKEIKVSEGEFIQDL